MKNQTRFTKLAALVEQRRQQAVRASPVPNGEQTRNGNGSQTQQQAVRDDFSNTAIQPLPPAVVGAEMEVSYGERNTQRNPVRVEKK